MPKQLTDEQTALFIRSIRNLLQSIKDLEQLGQETGYDPSNKEEMLEYIPEDRRDVVEELFKKMEEMERQ